MLTRYKGPLKLKDCALAIAKRSTMRKARIALARRLAIIMHAMFATAPSCTPCCATAPSSNRHNQQHQPGRRSNRAPERSDARGREQMTAPILADCDFNRATLHPADPIKCHTST